MTSKESRPVRRGAVGKVPLVDRPNGNSLAAYPTVLASHDLSGVRKCRAVIGLPGRGVQAGAACPRPRSEGARALLGPGE